jgi:hypothetical protein
MCKLNCLMDVLEEKSEKTSKTKYGFWKEFKIWFTTLMLT